jgi:hypothetical protein
LGSNLAQSGVLYASRGNLRKLMNASTTIAIEQAMASTENRHKDSSMALGK